MSTETSNVSETAEIILGDFRGAFRLFCQSWYNDLVFHGMNAQVAFKVACDCSSSFQQAISRGDATLAAKIGKAKKDGETSFKIGGKSSGTKMTRAMAVVRAVQQIEALRTEGLVLKGLPTFHNGLQEYLLDCEKWAKSQKWAAVSDTETE